MAAPLTPAARAAVRDLILVLADSKRLLGMRYANWMLGAPELEAGIACASMAQDEWGHARLLYALLKDFGDDPDAVEHARPPHEYRNIEVLDRAPPDWAGLVVLNALVDTALTVQLEALRTSRYTPLRQRVEKMLDEEQFHLAHATAWVHWFGRAGDAAVHMLRTAINEVSPAVLRWFGPDSERARTLLEANVIDAAGTALRDRFLARVLPVLGDIGALGAVPPRYKNFDETSRRCPGSVPDEETIRSIRGDKNRAFLMD
jgi:ring-1,2-phenylacetyl-CoA epoxidase subunit PaaC